MAHLVDHLTLFSAAAVATITLAEKQQVREESEDEADQGV
jgi:hypothetical protein